MSINWIILENHLKIKKTCNATENCGWGTLLWKKAWRLRNSKQPTIFQPVVSNLVHLFEIMDCADETKKSNFQFYSLILSSIFEINGSQRYTFLAVEVFVKVHSSIYELRIHCIIRMLRNTILPLVLRKI